MLQQITIHTNNIQQLKPIVKSALERESKLLNFAIERTHQALAPFEALYYAADCINHSLFAATHLATVALAVRSSP